MSMNELNGVQTARMLGVTVTDLRNWRKEGMPFVDNGGCRDRYILSEIFKWHQTRTIKDDESDMSAVEAKRRREVALALTAEVELALKRGQLVVIDDLMAEFVDSLVQVRASLIGQASRLTGLLSHQDEESVTKILNDDVEQILEALSKYKHDYRGQDENANTRS